MAMGYVWIVYSIHVKCILMQWPKGNKEHNPPLRENCSFFLIYLIHMGEMWLYRKVRFLRRENNTQLVGEFVILYVHF